jgi:hypothetical protein
VGVGFESGEEWATQQSASPHDAAQTSIATFWQHGGVDATADRDAICIHTSSTLNKIVVNCFTTGKLIASIRRQGKVICNDMLHLGENSGNLSQLQICKAII